MRARRFFAAVAAVMLVAPAGLAASAFCGRFELLEMRADDVLKALETQSLAVTAGDRPVACGLPGEALHVCRACVDKPTAAQWDLAKGFLAAPDHREWHYQWHQTFKTPPRPQAEGAKLRAWGLAKAGEDAAAYSERMARFPGESFLFMHRQMIRMLQLEMTALGLPCVAPWEAVPATALDPAWPIPQAVGADDEDQEIFDAQMRAVRVEAAKFEDPDFLKRVSLDELGTRLQGSLHIMLHTVYQNREEQRARDCAGPEETSPTCDDMGSNRSSQVNIYFWKLHGYIDGLLGRWLALHGHREIAVRCDGRPGCYEWKGAYLGPAYPGFGASDGR